MSTESGDRELLLADTVESVIRFLRCCSPGEAAIVLSRVTANLIYTTAGADKEKADMLLNVLEADVQIKLAALRVEKKASWS